VFPPKLQGRRSLDLALALTGSDHTEYATTIRLRTERLEVRPKVVKQRTGLYVREEAGFARTASAQ